MGTEVDESLYVHSEDSVSLPDFIPHIPAITTKIACETINVVPLDIAGISAAFTFHSQSSYSSRNNITVQ